MTLSEDDLIFCTVTGIEGAAVLLEIEGDDRKGTMAMSEVAAGRIRNLREYISPGRKIVCKVLKVTPDHIELSLRRVTTKERDQVLDAYKVERAFASVLKVVGEDPEKVIEKIKKDFDFVDFLDEARENIELLEKFVGGEKAKRVLEIISEKEGKERMISKKFILRSESGSGLSEIKEILDVKDAEIHYLGSSLFSISVFSKDIKEADNNLLKILEEIENKAKKKKLLFEVREK
jgi:translation initiation factor 2 alpha subunit (eIF-2alpha)